MTDIVDGLRHPLFPCMLEGGLLDKVNKQRADGADEIERLREALQASEKRFETLHSAWKRLRNKPVPIYGSAALEEKE